MIKSFTIFICGDLAFYATAQGRDGSSSQRCPLCDRNRKGFQETNEEGRILTLQYLNERALASQDPLDKTDKHGLKSIPMLQMEPNFYVCPLLHIEIGVCNKLLRFILDFLDDFVEAIPQTEITRRSELEEAKNELSVLITELNEIEKDKKRFTQKRIEENIKIKEKSKALKAAEREAKHAFTSNHRLVELTETIPTLKAEINEHRDSFEEHKNLASYPLKEFRDKEGLKMNAKSKFDQFKKECVDLKEKRKNDKNGCEAKIDDIMKEAASIKREAYHGGALNGMSCQRLLENAEQIIKRINDVSSDKLVQRTSDGYATINQNDLTNKLTSFLMILIQLEALRDDFHNFCPTKDLPLCEVLSAVSGGSCE